MSDFQCNMPFDPPPPPKQKGRRLNLTDQYFGRLHVISLYAKQGVTVYWLCRCECGKWTVKRASQLKQGVATACGCRRGKSENPPYAHTTEYGSYSSAKSRCNNPNFHAYSQYGGRGIEFRFNSFPDFFTELGLKPSPQHSLDRIDNDGHYEKGNVRWATRKEQQLNRRCNIRLTLDGETRLISEWAQIYRISVPAIMGRIKQGWCMPCTITNELNHKCPHRIKNKRDSGK